MEQVELGKTYRTRNGAATRIFATDGGGKYPVLGAYLDYAGEWVLARWTADGCIHCPECHYELDLEPSR